MPMAKLMMLLWDLRTYKAMRKMVLDLEPLLVDMQIELVMVNLRLMEKSMN
jgi:hypothetical protein